MFLVPSFLMRSIFEHVDLVVARASITPFNPEGAMAWARDAACFLLDHRQARALPETAPARAPAMDRS
jgi:hypothetical protein